MDFIKYAAFRSLRSTHKFVSLSTFLFILAISLSMSPCLGRNLYAIFALSSKLSNGGGNTKSSSVGILISGSKVSNPSPKSMPSIGGGWKIFLFCSSTILLLSSSKSLISLSFFSSNFLLFSSISLIVLGIDLS